MMPGLASGDRVIFTSFKKPASLFDSNKNRSREESYLFNRGNIVLVDMSKKSEQKWPLRAIDTVVRFFTAQKISIFSGSGQYYVKRVIALPGDEISMNNHVFRVKTSKSLYSLTEFELSDKPYHPAIPQIPSLWDESLPFSGNMEPIILGTDECFVVSDDRSNTNDSSTWGAIPPSMITARAVLRFWPLNKIQLL
jgi:signal peptidase I